ncbi:MAG: cytochrome C552 [Candidatus Sedimenticola endophacoides]|uniref:Cytochrome C552 n=1 Tax=Candidatus Sedimenticola endophacoides TaxID=2548426 RepID=A0A6N4DNZ0_9GAMM|nr:MAG: cytochrome C552 [Candidatus Sedimenticola endophacoides]
MPDVASPRDRIHVGSRLIVGQTSKKACKRGGVHTQLSDEELEELEKPWPAYQRPVPDMYARGLERVEAKEAEQEALEKEAMEQERQAKIAARKAEQERIQQAVAAALAAQGGGAQMAPAAATATGFGIDWGDVPARTITLLYPGETSMEWVLTGKDHGGARPLTQGGDRCVTCHEKEVADMGKKMVTGAKAETKPIPGKRPAIPVGVQAAHDGANLYLRFEWEEGDHAPVPFAEGGKMDPANPMKLALMLSTDQVEYADRSGCWQTCHHDASTMPDTPAETAGADAAQRLDLSGGVTKYLQESRGKIEVQGRRGKVRGGWDQLKSPEEIGAALAEGRFMDLLRYKSGQGETEDGYILDQRYMSGGQGFQANARQEGGNWVVEIKRPLRSDQPGDISIEPGQLYNFGFAIHDDHSSARFHHVSLGYKLGLDNDAAEVNVTAQ